MDEYYSILNLPTFEQCVDLIAKFSGPSDEYKRKYISEAKFKFVPVENEKSYNKYWEWRGVREDYKLCHFFKDGKRVNDKMYCVCCNLNEWYEYTRMYNEGKKLFDFFTRYEIAKYTKEEYKEFEEQKKKWKLSEPSHKPGKKYLKKTTVIIDLQTGEESPIKLDKYCRGYIKFGKYYTPENKRELYDIKTGRKILDYGYSKELESDKYVFYDTEYSFKQPKRVLMLNKETGEVTTWE